MRKFSIYLFLILITYPLLGQDFSISSGEKRFLLDFLNASEEDLLIVLQPLSEEQWNQAPDSLSWSPAQCMSHILQAEQGLFRNIQQLLSGPVNFEKDLRPNDAWLIGKITDRGVKVKSPLPDQEEILTKEEALKAFRNSRQEIRDFLKNPTLPLRAYIGKSPYGPADSYQLLLVIAAHSMRHKAQIDEILADL